MYKQKRNIIFTFDYELFLGKRSGSVDSCVIEPTQKILDIFSANKIYSAVFFIDTMWLIRLKEIALSNSNARKDYEKVVKQLRGIYSGRHYVFPHLHPHWINASYLPELNQWQLLDYSKYRFHNLDMDKRRKIFRESVELLQLILGHEYKPEGYRAGGWSIQPFEDFESLFNVYGVRYDFSVLPGNKYISTGQYYDFSDITTSLPYTFSKDITVPGKGDFVEFPISTIKISRARVMLNKILLKYLSLSNNNLYGNGQGIITDSIESSKSNKEMISIELLNRVKYPLYINYLRRNNYIQFIAHPKMLSPHNLFFFKRFIKKVFGSYDVNTDFRKIIILS